MRNIFLLLTLMLVSVHAISQCTSTLDLKYVCVNVEINTE